MEMKAVNSQDKPSFDVTVMEFVLPDRKKVQHIVKVDKNLEDKYSLIVNLNLFFAMERLENGTVDVCLENPIYGDFQISLSDRSCWEELIPEMIKDFDETFYASWEQGFIIQGE